MKKIIFIVVCLLSPWGVFAAGNWQLKENKNTLALSGACIEKAVRIDLFQAGATQPVYTSGATCIDGKFEFSENLLQWESLTDGQYELSVDGDRKNIKKISIQKPIEVAPAGFKNPKITQTTMTQENVSPEVKFLGAFALMQQALLDMRTWLAETSYPKLAKEIIALALDGVDSAVGKLSDRVMALENNATESEPVNMVAQEALPKISVETVQENTPTTEIEIPAGVEVVEKEKVSATSIETIRIEKPESTQTQADTLEVQ